MPCIETFVFFDLEATGTPERENNQTKITSAAFLATSKDDILNSRLGDTPYYKKLVLYVNPKREMTKEAVQMTGLTNAKLEQYGDFKSVFPQILEFLSGLPKPVCLIAHSGDKFDYRLLLAECKDAGLKMPEVYCADSFHILRGIDWGVNYSALRNNAPHLDKNERIVQWERCLKLTELYKRYVNKLPENAHNAEGDCVMLLRIAVNLKKTFVRRAEAQAKYLTKIEPLSR